MATRVESWRNRKTLILSRTDMMGLLTPAEYVACVEQAYRMHGEGRFVMEPKGHIVLDKYPGEWEAMPSYIAEPEAAACKWVSIREPTRSRETLDRFVAAQQPKYRGVEIRGSRDLEAVVRGADVVVTVTPARGPLVMNEWISEGTHIAALGADKGGDQELDPRILQRARIFVDDIRQCRRDGEINVPLAQGLLTADDIAGELGEVIVGHKPGRTSASQITDADATGS